MNDSLSVNTKQITNWFNAIRNLPDIERTRALDAFWASQIDSKCWVVNTLNSIVTEESNICIFGGWIGILASLLLEHSKFKINSVTSIDIDPWCEKISRDICKGADNFKSVTADMKSYLYDYDYHPNIVINTSTEHVDQRTYDDWFDRIPCGTLVVLQGNNFFSCDEHIRCSKTLLEFKRINNVYKCIFEGTLTNDLFDRFMTINIK